MDIMELELTKNTDNYCEKCISELPLARAYVPFQGYSTTYPIIEGLKMGTIFPDLNMPYKKPDKNYKPKRAC